MPVRLGPRCYYVRRSRVRFSIARQIVAARNPTETLKWNLLIRRISQFRRSCSGFAIFGSGGAGTSDEGAAFEGCGFGKRDVGHFAGKTFLRKLFSQRKEVIACRNQNPTESGVAFID